MQILAVGSSKRSHPANCQRCPDPRGIALHSVDLARLHRQGRQIPVCPVKGCMSYLKRRSRGFTLLELLVVLAIVAISTAGVSLTMRDDSKSALEREAQRLAALFESARAQSRAQGTPVYWRQTVDGFKFEGLAVNALPDRWLAPGTQSSSNVQMLLGPDPIIGPQSVDLLSIDATANQSRTALRVATDGLRPFTVQAVELP